MKKYQDRHLRKIRNTINVAYLTTAILWGVATCTFNGDRSDLKKELDAGKISHEQYISKCSEFSEKEESFFKDLAIGLGVIFASDVAFELYTRDKEL